MVKDFVFSVVLAFKYKRCSSRMSSICVAFMSKCPERTEIEPELPRQQGGVLATQNMRRKL